MGVLDTISANVLAALGRSADRQGNIEAALVLFGLSLITGFLFGLYVYRSRRPATESLSPIEQYAREGQLTLDNVLLKWRWYFLGASILTLVRAISIIVDS